MSWSRPVSAAPVGLDPAGLRGREPSGPAPGVAPAGPGTAPPMPPLPTAAAPAMNAAIVELPAGVSVGDVLKLEVLETGARLRLAARGHESAATPPGWQLDPLALRQVHGAAPDDAAALAVAWRAEIAQRLRSASAEIPGAASPAAASPVWPPAWLGLPVALSLAIPLPDEDEQPGHPLPPGLRRAPALRIVVDLPRLGRVAAQLQLAVGGITLLLACMRREAAPALHQVLPALAAALRDAGVALLRCSVQVGGLGGATTSAVPLGVLPPGSLLPPALFRAATAVVLALVRADTLDAAEPRLR